MRGHGSFVWVLFLVLAASAQDWQTCKPQGDSSFNKVKAAVYRVTSSGMWQGWDTKTFARSGDLVAVAVLKTLDDTEMGSEEHAKEVLEILRNAFFCPQDCVKVADDRRPRITLLLLEHLNEITGGKNEGEYRRSEAVHPTAG